ncbi:MAG TPA: HPP family protein [Halococcus sp.]|nr:HPP family protein [Halococcus sp.]
MIRDAVETGIYVGIHFVVLGLIAWATARPFLFPSLGPSAYLLAVGDGGAESDPRQVIGGHLIAVVCGLIGFYLFAPGLNSLELLGATSSPFASDLLRLTASSVVAMVLTTIVMVVTEMGHPAACATTLIASLGLISTPIGGLFIVLAVVALVGIHYLLIRPLVAETEFEPEDPR